jgi:transcriptional regulator of nitric oxide reductase
MLLCGAGVAALLAQQIIVNPDPSAELKRLFPTAAYAADPRSNPKAPPIGYAFWTPELVPQEHGYHGPIHILVGMDLTGILTGVIVDYDSEPYGYFSVEPPQFAAQFKGKSIRDPFRVGGDIDAVARASISITSAARAVRDSSRIAARALLDPEMVKR